MFSLTSRAMAPLAPAFAFLAVGWPTNVSPERTLRSVLFMALCDVESVEVMAERLTHDQVCRRFVGLSDGYAAPDARALALGQARLIRNRNARDVVRGVIGGMRSAGMLGEPPSAESGRLVQAWTSEEAP
jgi:hypothetical protein